MKPNKSASGPGFPNVARRKGPERNFSGRPTRVCRELSRQVEEIKRAMVREFGTAISGQGQLLNSALNEAEALAWQTPYPHLVFPVLAEEKATAVTRWAARQRSVKRASRQISLAA
jgi:hypothetical protein